METLVSFLIEKLFLKLILKRYDKRDFKFYIDFDNFLLSGGWSLQRPIDSLMLEFAKEKTAIVSSLMVSYDKGTHLIFRTKKTEKLVILKKNKYPKYDKNSP